MSLQYYTLPQNTSGAANIPIYNTPTPLVILTVTPGSGNDIGTVRANIGWEALTGTVQVIFKIWRGAPVSGQLVCSVQDSAERSFDNLVTTDFSGVVTGLTANQPVTFVLTAETVGTAAQARVVGPLTMTIFDISSNIVSYYQFPNNVFGAASVPVAQTPVPVGFIVKNVEPGQNVILRHTACWVVTSGGSVFPKVDMLFKIWRGAPVTGTLVASADDSADLERGAVTSFSHVDRGFTSARTVTYVITAEIPEPGHTASIVGAFTITGSTQAISSFSTLPDNNSGSVNIPITTSATPLAAITAQASPGLDLVLRASVGWQLPAGPVTPILFKIWRGSPNIGTLIYSAIDTGEGNFDFRKVTSLAHVDRGFAASGPVTYTLTAELTNPGTAASVIGPLTFTAVPEN